METQNSIKVQYVSDIHLEIWGRVPQEIKRYADTLILAGDIGNIRIPLMKQFIKDISALFKDVIFVPGNHEYYQMPGQTPYTMEQCEKEFQEIASIYQNFHYLQKGIWKHPSGLEIYGTTCWSYIPDKLKEFIVNCLNDYHLIFTRPGKIMDPVEYNSLFLDQSSWLLGKIEEGKPCIVVTHHIPSTKMCPKEFIGDNANCAFNSDLEALMQKNVKLWVCGHSHYETIENIKGVPVAINAIGYPMERSSFNINKLFEIKK